MFLVLRNSFHVIRYPFIELTVGKGKAIPLEAWTGPEGSRRFQDTRHMKVVRLAALRTGRLYPSPRKYCWYSFLLEAESTPGP